MDDGIVQQDAPPRSGFGWQVIWFVGHLVVVYGVVSFCTPWIAGFVRRLMMLVGEPTSLTSFEFLFDHIFLFSFIPALLLGLFLPKSGHQTALLVWLLPAAILAYKFLTFPSSSVFSSQFSAAYHHYFEGAFIMPDLRTRDDFLALAPGDAIRALAQLQITAPFYAAIAYSAGSWAGYRFGLAKKISDRIEEWEHTRFPRKEDAESTEDHQELPG